MNTTQTIGNVKENRQLEEKKSAKTVLGGSVAESFLGGATIVVSLIGLSGVLPVYMLSIAAIAMGAAFLLEGGAVSTRFSKLLSETSKSRLDEAEFGAGVTSEFVGGVAGVVLGILSLLGLSPMILVPVAVIVFGGVLMFSSGLTLRLNALEIEGMSGSTRFVRLAHEAMSATAGVEFLLGLSVVVLGIIALTGIYVSVLTLVAMLITGVTGFTSGVAVSARMSSLFRR